MVIGVERVQQGRSIWIVYVIVQKVFLVYNAKHATSVAATSEMSMTGTPAVLLCALLPPPKIEKMPPPSPPNSLVRLAHCALLRTVT